MCVVCVCGESEGGNECVVLGSPMRRSVGSTLGAVCCIFHSYMYLYKSPETFVPFFIRLFPSGLSRASMQNEVIALARVGFSVCKSSR